MDTTSASRSGTTSPLSDVVRSGTRTTTWRQELPGVWVANRDNAVVGALQCLTISGAAPIAVPFQSLEDARQAAHGQIRTSLDSPGRTPVRTGAPKHVRGIVRALGLLLGRALSPQLRA